MDELSKLSRGTKLKSYHFASEIVYFIRIADKKEVEHKHRLLHDHLVVVSAKSGMKHETFVHPESILGLA